MLIRCRLIGSGIDGDPFRCSLPIYNMVEVDYPAAHALVDVPNDTLPHALLALPPQYFLNHARGRVLFSLPPGIAALWYQHLDRRYVEHVGSFRPEVM